MKIVLVLLLSLLLTTSYAVTLKAKARAVLKALSDNNDGLPSYKAVFKSLLQMTDANEYDQVNDILVEVQGEIQGLLNAAQQKLDDENDSYNAQVQALDAQIEDLGNQLSEAEETLETDTAQRDSLQDLIATTQQAIADNQAAVEREKERRASSEEGFINQISGLTDAIAQADAAIQILNDVNDEDLPAGGSFLEVKTKRVQKNLEVIETKLKQIKSSNTAISFVQSLIKIAQNGINNDDIQAIISLLEDIKASLQSQLDEARESNQLDEQTSQNTLSNLASTIESETELVNTNQATVDQLIPAIDNLTQKIATLKGGVNDLNELLDELGALHTVAVTSLDDLIGRLERDLEALGQALSFLQSQRS